MILKYGLYIIWLISMIASATCLYLIEVQNWPVSRLAWYQLVCIMPLTVIAGRAAWLGFYGITQYIFPQAIVGLCIALYQFILQLYCVYPIEQKFIYICNPKEEIFTFPWRLDLACLSTVAFLLINILLFLIKRKIHEK